MLKADSIGTHDDFFELGGNSLLAIQFVSRLRKQAKIDLPVKAVFESLTIANLCQYIEKINQKEASIFNIEKVNRSIPHPISPMQDRLWFMQELLPDSYLYNNYLCFNLMGDLNINGLRFALNKLAERHEILRTSIFNQDGIGVQRVLPEDHGFQLTECDESSGIEISAFINEPFSFVDGKSLCRSLLQKQSKNKYSLVMVFHHLAIDGWSNDILLEELPIFYKSFCDNAPITLEPLTIQYIDFSVWQRSYLSANFLKSQLEYWYTQLNDVQPLALHTDFERPKVQSYSGGYLESHLSHDIVKMMKNYAIEHETTLFAIGLSVCYVFLYRHTQQNEILVGSPIANRKTMESESLIGFFVNTLVFKGKVTDEMSFNDLVENTKVMTLEAYANDSVPFDQLVDYLKLERTLSKNPLFQVELCVDERESQPLKLEGVESSLNIVDYSLSRFDLRITLQKKSNGFTLGFEYSKDLFRESTIDRMSRYFSYLCNELLKSPEQPISKIQRLLPCEQSQFLNWNKPNYTLAEWKDFPKQFAERITNRSSDTAVIFRNNSFSFQQLNERANQLAHYLIECGAGSEKVVAIIVEPGFEMVMTLLAILKSGACYLPIDPKLPAARIAYILDDCNAALLLVKTAELVNLPEAYDPNLIIQLENIGLLLEGKPKYNPSVNIHRDSLAYIIYTSGSTGKPKGVAITHFNMVGYLNSVFDLYQKNNKNPVLLHGSIAFDMSITSVWLPLLTGNPIYIADFSALLENEDIDIYFSYLKITPSHLKMINSSRYKNNCEKLTNCFIVGGELLKSTDLPTHRDGLDIFNEYGPTEATVANSFYKISGECGGVNVPIGKPFPNSKLYVLDKNFNRVPVGVVGEIYISGLGLARAYLNNPKLTAEKFIPNPFIDEVDVAENLQYWTRMYRTGDLGRYLPDGNVEYIDRSDNQVKIKGYRIELGEIENLIQGIPEVRDAIVLCSNERIESGEIIAYVTPNNTGIGTLVEKICRDMLPEYMRPQQLVVMDQLPLTLHGKVDKKALSKIKTPLRSTEFASPQTFAENILSELWSNLLGIEKIGRNDNFFQIGGDSILSIQLVAQARQKGLTFNVKQVFESPTLSALAANIEQITPQVAKEISVTDELYLGPIQHWFFQQDSENVNHYNQSVMIEYTNAVDIEKLKNAFKIVYEHHNLSRLGFEKMENNTWKPKYISDNTPPWNYFLNQDNAQQQQICKKLQGSLNIEKGPLSQIACFDTAPFKKGQLLWVIHHLLVDAVSWRILIEDLNNAYQGKLLSCRTDSYQKWARSLQDYDNHDVLSYYQPQEKTPYSEEHYDGKVTFGDTKDIWITFSKEHTNQFLHKAHAAFNTQPNDLLLLAFVLALGDMFGSYHISLDMEGHGRENLGDNLDLSRTVGWFTSIYPISIDLTNIHKFAHRIKHVKEILRGIPDKGASYGVLAYILKKIRLNKNDFLFNYLGQWSSLENKNSFFYLVASDLEDSISPQQPFEHKLAVNGGVNQGNLSFCWTYSEKHYNATTIEKLAKVFQSHLSLIVEYCCVKSHYGYTPSDFPLSHLSQADIDKKLIFSDIQAVYPVSPIQSGLLFRGLLEPISEAYFVQTVIEIENILEPIDYIKKAWDFLLERHECLRAMFLWEDLNEPIQVIRKNISAPWFEFDWVNLNYSQRADALKNLMLEDRNKGFQFSEPPLMRFYLIKVESQKYLLLWSHHHLIMDGWSSSILLNEFKFVYKKLFNAEPVELPCVKKYEKFIEWVQDQNISSVVDYWKTSLRGLSPTKLCHKKANAKIKANEILFSLSANKTSQLIELSRKAGVTLNTILQAAWSILLGNQLNKSDVVFGVTVSGRQIDMTGIEEMVGIFINTLPLRIQLNISDSLFTLLHQIQTSTVNLQNNTQIPLSLIHSFTNVGNKGLFDTVIVYQNFPPIEENLNETTRFKIIDCVDVYEYPLKIVVSPGEELELRFSYNTLCFTQETIEAYISDMSHIIENMILYNADFKLDKYITCFSNLNIPSKIDDVHYKLNKINKTISKMEFALLEIWKKLLNVDVLYYEDDFFELGGHSIQILTLISEINNLLQIKISLCDVLEHSIFDKLLKLLKKRALESHHLEETLL